MSRYIDADELIKQIDIDSKGNEGQYGDEWQFMDTIRRQPTADVVEVVRCKDCKHNYMKSWNQGKRDNPICHFTDFRRSNEFYCGFGERAEE